MTNLSKLDLLRLARELTESTDIDALIQTANKVSQYLGVPYADPISLHEKISFEKFLNLVKVQYPNHGSTPFKPYDFQLTLARRLESQKHVVINSARQMGTTLIAAAYALWYALYHPDRTVLIQAHRYMPALEIIDRIKYIYENLVDPKQEVAEYIKGAISFDNGSRILCRTALTDSNRGLSVDLLILDQAAFISHGHANDYWLSIQPMLDTGGRMIMISTPLEDTGLFHSVFANAPSNGFEPITLPWDLHPDRDQQWADQHRAQLGDDTFKQEYECQFLPAK